MLSPRRHGWRVLVLTTSWLLNPFPILHNWTWQIWHVVLFTLQTDDGNSSYLRSSPPQCIVVGEVMHMHLQFQLYFVCAFGRGNTWMSVRLFCGLRQWVCSSQFYRINFQGIGMIGHENKSLIMNNSLNVIGRSNFLSELIIQQLTVGISPVWTKWSSVVKMSSKWDVK